MSVTKTFQIEGIERMCKIGTHCSREELHLSQVLVTTQMIRRYYWNLGTERNKNKTNSRSTEVSLTETTLEANIF